MSHRYNPERIRTYGIMKTNINSVSSVHRETLREYNSVGKDILGANPTTDRSCVSGVFCERVRELPEVEVSDTRIKAPDEGRIKKLNERCAR